MIKTERLEIRLIEPKDLENVRKLHNETYSAINLYLFDKFKFNRLSLTTLANNYAAISLYKKLGYRKEGVMREAFYKNGKFIDGFFYSMLRSDLGE